MGRRHLKVLSTWIPDTRSRSHSGPRQRGRSPHNSRSGERTWCGDEVWGAESPRSRSMSPQGRSDSPGAREEELRKVRRQTKEKYRIIERTKNSLFREVTKGAKEMRLMGERLTKLLEPLHDIRCNMCISEGRFREKPWPRAPSIDRDDSRRPSEDQVRIGDRLRREAAARGMRATEFDDTRLTKILREGKELLMVQLWQEAGGPVWRQVLSRTEVEPGSW